MSFNQRTLEFWFQDDGLLEAVAFGPMERREGLITEGYRDCGIPDLMVDLHPDHHQPYSFMSLNFPQSYPAIIWGLRLLMNDERFNLPQAGRYSVPLAEAFSWAYSHFVLEQQPIIQEENLTRHVLEYALVTV